MPESESRVEEVIRNAVDQLVPVIEGVAALFVVAGAVIAIVVFIGALTGVEAASYEGVRLRLARFIVLGLEFQLAADVLATAVSPTFDQIGRLAAVAGIRTVLTFVLSREIERNERLEREGMLSPIRPARARRP